VTASQEQPILFQTVASDPQGVNGLIGETPRLFLITSLDELNRLQDLVAPDHFRQLRTVDFQGALLIALFAGTTPTGQRPNTIARVALRDADLVVYVHSKPVTDTLNASLAIASPYQFVQIARNPATFAPRHLVLHTEGLLAALPPAALPESPLSATSPLAIEPGASETLQVTPVPDTGQ
jgi:hypothetical protein